MKRNVLLGTLTLLAGSLLAADSGLKEEVQSAAKLLGEKANYSWKINMEFGAGGPGRLAATEGKTQKGGFTTLTMPYGDNVLEAVMQEGKGVLNSAAGWQTFEEIAAGNASVPNPARSLARMLQNYKLPAGQAEDLLNKTKTLKKVEGAYQGEMTEAGATDLLTFRGPAGTGAGPSATNALGGVRFWLKDGLLIKYQVRVQGTVHFNGTDRAVDRTTTVEIKDVGATKITVPEAAKKKMPK